MRPTNAALRDGTNALHLINENQIYHATSRIGSEEATTVEGFDKKKPFSRGFRCEDRKAVVTAGVGEPQGMVEARRGKYKESRDDIGLTRQKGAGTLHTVCANGPHG